MFARSGHILVLHILKTFKVGHRAGEYRDTEVLMNK